MQFSVNCTGCEYIVNKYFQSGLLVENNAAIPA